MSSYESSSNTKYNFSLIWITEFRDGVKVFDCIMFQQEI